MSISGSTISSQASHHADTPSVAMQLSRNLLVASIQVDLVDSVLDRFREDLLQRVHSSACRGVILDLSGLETLDCAEFASLRRIMDMLRIMGAESVLVGMQPGVVSALVETGADIDGLRSALDLDAAFAMFEPEIEEPAAEDSDAGVDLKDHLEQETVRETHEQQ